MPFTENQSYVFRLTRRAQITLAFYYGHETEDPRDLDQAPTCTAWYRGEPENLTVLQRAHLFAGQNIHLQLHGGPLILATVNTDLAPGDTAGTIESVIAMSGSMLSLQGRELAELVYAAHVIMPESMNIEEARHFGDRVRDHGDFSAERFRADLQGMLDTRTQPETSHLRGDYENLEQQLVRLTEYARQLEVRVQELEGQSQGEEERNPELDEFLPAVPQIAWEQAGTGPNNRPIYRLRNCRVLYLDRNGEQSAVVYEFDGRVYRLKTRFEVIVTAYAVGESDIYFIRYAGEPYLAPPMD